MILRLDAGRCRSAATLAGQEYDSVEGGQPTRVALSANGVRGDLDMNVDSSTTAFITGGCGGIGAATAERLRAAGATVVVADLGTAGSPDVVLDVTDLAATRSALQAVAGDHGRLDVVIACAGVGVGGPADQLDDEAWARAIDVNLVGTINTIRSGYEMMLPIGRGHLVAVASLAGLVPSPLLVPYAAAKGGVVSFMTSLRVEARRTGVGVSVVCPGPVDTTLLDTGGAGGVVTQVDIRRHLTNAAGPAIAPSAVAAAVIRAIVDDRAVVAPKRARLLYLAGRLLPHLTEREIARSLAQELEYG